MTNTTDTTDTTQRTLDAIARLCQDMGELQARRMVDAWLMRTGGMLTILESGEVDVEVWLKLEDGEEKYLGAATKTYAELVETLREWGQL